MSFHSRQAAWHALQPMHFDTSMSLATSVSLRDGSGTEDAERRTRSASPNIVFGSLVLGLGSSNSNDMIPSLRHRSGDGLDIDQPRLVLRRLRIGVADKGRQRIRPEALAGLAHESPMQRNADHMHRLAVADQRPDTFGHKRLGLH